MLAIALLTKYWQICFHYIIYYAIHFVADRLIINTIANYVIAYIDCFADKIIMYKLLERTYVSNSWADKVLTIQFQYYVMLT